MTVVFDEYQVVLQAELDALIRSVIQHHGRGVTYVFSGSHPGMMTSLFADRTRPFYGPWQVLDLEVTAHRGRAACFELLLNSTSFVNSI